MATLCASLAYSHAHGGLRSLTLLSLQRNKIGDDSAEAIAQALASGVLGRLEWLQLNTNRIGDRGHTGLAAALAQPSVATRLAQLSLTGNIASEEGVAALRGACCRDEACARIGGGGKGIYLQLDEPAAEPPVVECTVVIDGVTYTGEEAMRKFAEL